MAMIAYDGDDAEAFRATRHIAVEGLTAWRAAVARHLRPVPGMRLLDLGAGTGMWARAFTAWYDGLQVIAVEPSAEMRSRCEHPNTVAATAENIPLADRSVDAAWLSTVIHHVADVDAAARELRRVVRPGGPILIRSLFPGRHQGVTLFRYWPEAVRVVDAYPSLADVTRTFGSAGFAVSALDRVPQITAPSLRVIADRLRRDAHTPLKLISDDEFATGLARLRAAADSATADGSAVVDTLDLLVLR